MIDRCWTSLAQAHAARVRADRDAGLGRHEQHREDLIDATKAASVDLAHADRVGLQQLLEHHPVVDVLAGRHATGATARAIAAWPRMSSGLVGSSIQ